MTIKESRIALLQNMPVFGGVSEATLQFLLEAAPIIFRQDRERFFSEGDEACSFFVLESGSAVVLKAINDMEYVIARIEVGDCFGEMAVVDMAPRSGTVLATSDASAIELFTSRLYELYQCDIEQFTIIQMNVGREICRRLRRADKKIFDAAAKGKISAG